MVLNRSVLNRATSSSPEPTPGSLFNEILIMTEESPSIAFDVLEFFNTRLTRPEWPTKLKSLKIICFICQKSLPFRKLCQRNRICDIIRSLSFYTCPSQETRKTKGIETSHSLSSDNQSPLESTNRSNLVRAEVEKCLQAIFATEIDSQQKGHLRLNESCGSPDVHVVSGGEECDVSDGDRYDSPVAEDRYTKRKGYEIEGFGSSGNTYDANKNNAPYSSSIPSSSRIVGFGNPAFESKQPPPSALRTLEASFIPIKGYLQNSVGPELVNSLATAANNYLPATMASKVSQAIIHAGSFGQNDSAAGYRSDNRRGFEFSHQMAGGNINLSQSQNNYNNNNYNNNNNNNNNYNNNNYNNKYDYNNESSRQDYNSDRPRGSNQQFMAYSSTMRKSRNSNLSNNKSNDSDSDNIQTFGTNRKVDNRDSKFESVDKMNESEVKGNWTRIGTSTYKPPITKRDPGDYESRLIDDIVDPAGVRLSPSQNLLNDFCIKCCTLDLDTVATLLTNKLSPPDNDKNVQWQPIFRALCVLEALLMSKEVVDHEEDNDQDNGNTLGVIFKRVILRQGILNVMKILPTKVPNCRTKWTAVENLLRDKSASSPGARSSFSPSSSVSAESALLDFNEGGKDRRQTKKVKNKKGVDLLQLDDSSSEEEQDKVRIKSSEQDSDELTDYNINLNINNRPDSKTCDLISVDLLGEERKKSEVVSEKSPNQISISHSRSRTDNDKNKKNNIDNSSTVLLDFDNFPSGGTVETTPSVSTIEIDTLLKANRSDVLSYSSNVSANQLDILSATINNNYNKIEQFVNIRNNSPFASGNVSGQKSAGAPFAFVSR